MKRQEAEDAVKDGEDWLELDETKLFVGENQNTGENKTDFCTQCRKNTEYVLQKKPVMKAIKGKEYLFSTTTVICMECGGEMSIPGLIDINVQEICRQYRAAQECGNVTAEG